MLTLLCNMTSSLSFSHYFRAVIHIIPKVCEKSRGLEKLFVEIIIPQIHSFVNEAFAMRIWSRSHSASVKRRLCRHEARRTFFILYVAKQRFIAVGCFMSCYATRLMHRRCASLQQKTKAVQWTAFVFCVILTKYMLIAQRFVLRILSIHFLPWFLT